MAFAIPAGTRVAVAGEGRSLDYARWLLEQLGIEMSDAASAAPDTPIIAGHGMRDIPDPAPAGAPFVVHAWDFHVEHPGTGAQACAVAGVSWVIGLPEQAPLYLPAEIPEKWCGVLAVSLALTSHVERLFGRARARVPRRFDVSAAEILRGFADQNFGNHKQIPQSWRRNGRTSPEHGGIFPQGFFPCKDGLVGIVGRSRQDWHNILKAIGDPAWAVGELRDPFHLAEHAHLVEDTFEQELLRFTRDELLDRAIATGATIAPVFDRTEVASKHIVRDDLFGADGLPGLPFDFGGKEIGRAHV